MNSILQASYINLSKSKNLLLKLSNRELCNEGISPYYSSIGSHIRHVLDFYNCIFKGIDDGVVDLTDRDRNTMVENDCNCAEVYVDDILTKLENIQLDINKSITVFDDLGQGKIGITYTLGALIAQANSHTIHHYAIINYILDRLGIEMEDKNFGFNPTSPKKVLNN